MIRFILIFSLLGLALVPGVSHAQLPNQPVRVILIPAAEDGSPVEDGTLFGDPNLPPVFPNTLTVNLGFEFLRPAWTSDAVSLQIPPALAGGFSSFGNTDNLSEEFAFIPQFGLEYQFEDLGFGVSTSAKLMRFQGNLQRTFNSETSTVALTANGQIDIATANVIEAVKRFTLGKWACFQDTRCEDTLVALTVGGRYGYVHQEFVANATSGAIGSSRSTNQSFSGFGLTSSISTLDPLGDSAFSIYTVSRGSMLYGTNNRTSSLSLTTTGDTTPTEFSTATEQQTELIGVGEFEIGVAWGTILQPQAVTAAGNQMGTLLWLKAGFVAQIWGDVGLLTLTADNQSFSSSSLFLYGFSIMGGIEF